MGGEIDEDGQSHSPCGHAMCSLVSCSARCALRRLGTMLFAHFCAVSFGILTRRWAHLLAVCLLGGLRSFVVVSLSLSSVCLVCLSVRPSVCLSVCLSCLVCLVPVSWGVGCRGRPRGGRHRRHCGFTRAWEQFRVSLATAWLAAGMLHILVAAPTRPAAWRSVSGCPLGLGAGISPGAQPSSRIAFRPPFLRWTA